MFLLIILPANIFMAFFVYRYFFLRFSLFNHNSKVLHGLRYLCYLMAASLPLSFVFGRFFSIAPLSFFFNSLFGALFLLFIMALPIFVFLPLFTRLPNRIRLLLEGRESLYLSFSLFFVLCSFSLGLLPPVVESVDIPFPRLDQGQMKVVQLSDMHLGPILREGFARQVVERVNSLQADVVVITGDLVDQKTDDILGPIGELAKLKSKYGVYFCLGNHEYYAGDIPRLLEVLRQNQIIPIVNGGVLVGEGSNRVNLLAVADRMGKRFSDFTPDLAKTLEAIDPKYPTILLSHHPIDPNSIDGKVQLILSGHTHGGQVLPFDLPVWMVHHFLEGLYLGEKTALYVNRGTGFWGPPIRFPRGGEISELNLKSAPSHQ